MKEILQKMTNNELYVSSDSYKRLFKRLLNHRYHIIDFFITNDCSVTVKEFWNMIIIDNECKCNLGKLDYASKSKCTACKIISRFVNLDTLRLGKSFVIKTGSINKKLVIYEESAGIKSYMNILKKWIFENFCKNEKIEVPLFLQVNIKDFIKVDNTTMSTICEWYSEKILCKNEYPHSITCEFSFICNESYFTLMSYRNDVKYIPLQIFIKTATVREIIEILYQLLVIFKKLKNLYYGGGIEGIYIIKKEYSFPLDENRNTQISARVCIGTFTNSALIVENNGSKYLYFSENILDLVLTYSENTGGELIMTSPIYGSIVSLNIILNEILLEKSFINFINNRLILDFIEKITYNIFRENLYELSFKEIEEELMKNE